MIKNKLLKTGVVFIGFLLSITQLNAETVTYYFTGATNNSYSTLTNWNTERDNSGTLIPDNNTLQNTADVTLIVPSGKTVNFGSSGTIKGELIIEGGATVTSAALGFIELYGRYSIEKGGIQMSNGFDFRLFTGARIEIAGEYRDMASYAAIRGATPSQSDISIEVKPDGVLHLDDGDIINNVKLINNGTVSAIMVAVGVIEGNGSLSSQFSFSVADVTNSTFLQTGGGTVIYTGIYTQNFALLSQYNQLEIKGLTTANKNYTGNATVLGNLSIAGNTGLTLAGTIDVKGNLNVSNTKVVTGNVIQVAGDVATSGLAEGSILNVTLTGTAQNIQGTGITNLVVPAGTTATLTGDLTVTNLVNSGTINENGHTLTVINQVASLVAELQGIINGIAANYMEADYTVESWAALQEAITAAQALLAVGANPTTVDLETAKNAVTAAIDALVTNRSVLESRINAAKTGYANPTVYTEATYQALQTVITSLETFLSGVTAITTAQMEEKTAELNTAIAALVRMHYTFYLTSGGTSLVSPLNYDKWNTERDGSGIQAVPFTPENTGHTYIIPDFVVTGANSTTFYGSHLILEEGTTRTSVGVELNGSNLTVESGRTFGSSYIRTYTGEEVIRVKTGGTFNSPLTGSGGEVTVEEGGTITGAFNGDFNVEINGTAALNGGQFTTLTGTGTITAASFDVSDAANSTFLQAGGGTLVYRSAATFLPSYNHLTIENLTTASAFSREEAGAYPSLTVYGNLQLQNNSRRVTITNPLDVRGDFTVDYDIVDEAIIQATLTVSGNVSLSGLLAEDNTLNVMLSGTAQELSGAGLTNLTVPATTTATLTGDLSVENDLVLNGVLDLNGFRLSSGYTRTGDGVLTDSQLAARLQTAIDDAQADYPNSSLYTAASWEPFADAVEQGLALLSGDDPAEATALQSALDDLAAAVAGLELLTGIDRITAEDLHIDAQSPGSLRIAGTADVKVFTLTGIQLFGGRVNGEKTLSLSSGVYVVSVNGKAAKVVVK